MSIEALSPRLRWLVWRDGSLGPRAAVAAFAERDLAVWVAHTMGPDVQLADLDSDPLLDRGFTATLSHPPEVQARVEVRAA